MLHRFITPLALMVAATVGCAQSVDIDGIIEGHILPRFTAVANTSAALQASVQANCAAGDASLIPPFHAAFDAWIGASHLRFGPTEAEDRAFALAFWPDSRGATPKALSHLLRDTDPVVTDPKAFTAVSIAARGFYALEFLFFDPAFVRTEDPKYRCALIEAIATDIARNSADILNDWQDRYADLLRGAGTNDLYQSKQEAAQELFKAMLTGLQFTSDTRLGRAMGSFERPRPNRAEARRSGRSLHHVHLSLAGTRALGHALSGGDADLMAAFDKAEARANRLQDPVFANVVTPQGRLRVEVLQQAIEDIRLTASVKLGPSLGVAAGFNALDGD